jgi:hypothetical protein
MAQNVAIELLQLYRLRLNAGASQSPASEVSLYASHQEALGELENAMEQNALESVLGILKKERRAFGWSFLSGDMGNEVESAFHRLATELEK